MIITLAGEAGSGKSTCAKNIAKLMNLTHYSTGDLMRQMADERKISLAELSKIAENDSSIDKELDDRQIKLGKTEDNFIIDGRLSSYFIPHALKVFVTADINVRANRILSASRAEESFLNISDAIESIKQRKESEIKRYISLYKFNPYDLKIYDIIYDTSDKNLDNMINDLIKTIKNKIQSKNYFFA